MSLCLNVPSSSNNRMGVNFDNSPSFLSFFPLPRVMPLPPSLPLILPHKLCRLGAQLG